jgi:hypothetical protein
VAVLVSRWVGARWAGARPAVVFWGLRWLLAGIAALLVASLFHWWGCSLRKAIHAGPGGAVDRILGLPLGAMIGMGWAIAVLVVALLSPRSFGLGAELSRARTPHALVSLGAQACDVAERRVPILHRLGRWLHEAERRARVHSQSS